MSKLTNNEKKRLINKATILCENAILLLDKCYKEHIKETERRKLTHSRK